MHLTFALLALVILASAAVALALRDLIRTALLLVVTWGGVAGFFLWAGAEFVAFAQVLVYVGAISMVVLFAVLLTRRSRAESTAPPARPRRRAPALGAGAAVFALLAWAVLRTPSPAAPAAPPPAVGVRALGIELMRGQAGAVLAIGGLLTVALLGSVSLAADLRPRKEPAQ